MLYHQVSDKLTGRRQKKREKYLETFQRVVGSITYFAITNTQTRQLFLFASSSQKMHHVRTLSSYISLLSSSISYISCTLLRRNLEITYHFYHKITTNLRSKTTRTQTQRKRPLFRKVPFFRQKYLAKVRQCTTDHHRTN